jgi:hypothetical protein
VMCSTTALGKLARAGERMTTTTTPPPRETFSNCLGHDKRPRLSMRHSPISAAAEHPLKSFEKDPQTSTTPRTRSFRILQPMAKKQRKGRMRIIKLIRKLERTKEPQVVPETPGYLPAPKIQIPLLCPIPTPIYPFI